MRCFVFHVNFLTSHFILLPNLTNFFVQMIFSRWGLYSQTLKLIIFILLIALILTFKRRTISYSALYPWLEKLSAHFVSATSAHTAHVYRSQELRLKSYRIVLFLFIWIEPWTLLWLIYLFLVHVVSLVPLVLLVCRHRQLKRVVISRGRLLRNPLMIRVWRKRFVTGLVHLSIVLPSLASFDLKVRW